MTANAILENLYSDAPVIGRTGKVFNSGGALSTKSNLREIERIMRLNRPNSTLEIGMAFGGSTLVFASVGWELCPGSYHHIAIDPFQHTVWDGVGKQCVETSGFGKCFELIEEPSCLALPRLLSQEERFGVIYVDGSHLFEDVFLDAYFGARLLSPGGYIFFDDSSHPHVAKVLSFIETNVMGLTRVPERCLRHRVARLLGKRQLSIYQRTGDIERRWNSRFARF